ncbi:MAG: hypothetical protein WBW93_14945 [Steroidobacteraceae bacterium]
MAVAAVVIFALGLIAGRLLRANDSGRTVWWAALGCAAILLIGSAILYTFLSHPSARQSAGASPSVSPSSPAGAARVRVEVQMSPALEARAPRAASLYVFVRDPAAGGPPLAVKRLAGRLPQIVELTAADAMIAGHAIAAGERVQVVARISPSGNPMDEAGDLSGQAEYRIGHDGLVDVVIDRVTP